MNNHFNLALETPLGNLVAVMKWFLGAYMIRFVSNHPIVLATVSECQRQGLTPFDMMGS